MASVNLRGMPVGQILVQLQLLAEAQVREALQIHRVKGIRLGQALIEQGYISDRDLGTALSKQFGIPFIADPEEIFELEVAKLVDEFFVRKHEAIPIQRRPDGSVTLGMVFPGNLEAIDDVSSRARKRMVPAVITQRALDRLVVKAYGSPVEVVEAQNNNNADQVGAVRVVNDLLEQALDQRASDLHMEPLEAGLRIRYRIDGIMSEVAVVPGGMMAAAVSRVKVMAGLDISERRLPQDGRIELEHNGRKIDMRVATIPAVYGERVTIRLLDQSGAQRKIEDLGLPKEIDVRLRQMISRSHGIVLVTGPTGSGKSTTLSAMLGELNTPDQNVLTIEDPVEYRIPGVTQVQVNPKTGLTFATGLRSFLRHDPNVIMVGEIRDTETAEIAIRAALTGHLVLSTLHTIQASGAITRLVEMGIAKYLVAAAVTGVIAQRLVRRLCPRCRQPASVDPYDILLRDVPEEYRQATFYGPRGCNYCEGVGYRGRLALLELLPITTRLAATIVDKPEAQAIEQAAREEGLITLMEYGLTKALAGETSLDEIRRAVVMEV